MTTFSFEETENDSLKKRAKKQYSEFLETLDLDSLKNEVETPCYVWISMQMEDEDSGIWILVTKMWQWRLWYFGN